MTAMSTQTSYYDTRDLVDFADVRPYLFIEHGFAPGYISPFRRHHSDHRTFVVTQGSVEVQWRRPETGLATRQYPRLAGWHATPGCVYRIWNTAGRPAVLIEAGSPSGETWQALDPDPLIDAVPERCLDVSSYLVRKPWGHEVWYTQNLPGLPYAVKQIHMAAGHQSSLQSHSYKRETNYVLEGEALVLSGALAPTEPAATIDVDSLVITSHPVASHWSSPPRELHRVIARSDYTSIEVSTPELDDVIRWQDDSGREHGRIEAEHAGARP